MSSITLTYSRSDKAIDLTWTLTGISATAPIILLADTTDKPTKQIVLDAGTTSYTVQTDDYFIAHPDTLYNFVIMGTSSTDSTQLVTSNEISVGLVEIPRSDFTLVPLNKAFRVDFTDNLLVMEAYHAQLAEAEITSYDAERSITQVVVSVTTTSPLSMWQAVYNVADMTANNIIVGLDGQTPAASSKADLTTVGLVNFQTYEVNVAYVSDETTDGAGNTNGGSLGRGEGTTTPEYVVPSLLFSAPRNVTIVETPNTNDQVDIYWNAPGNDLGHDGGVLTTVTKYQIYRTASSTAAASTPTFTDTIPADWSLVKEVTPTGTDTIYQAYSDLENAQTVSTKMWYVVRAVRVLATSPTGVIEEDRDGDVDETSYGTFCAPVPFTTFVHTDLQAPTLSNFSVVVNVAAITFDATSPANATTLALDATGYTAQKLLVAVHPKMPDQINNYGHSMTYTLEQGTQNYTNSEQTIDKLTDGTTDLTFGVSYKINSAVYVQPGLLINLGTEDTNTTLQTIGTTATEYTSADAGPSNQLQGGNLITRTLFTTPVAAASPSSTGLAADNTPLSTADDGKLDFSWTNLATYDNDTGSNSRFYSSIKYRVFGAVTTPTSLVDGTSSIASPNAVENLAGPDVLTTGLTLGTSYPLQVQAYFYNDEMGVWVTGTKTAAVSSGNVPFFYPASVTDLAYDGVDSLTWSTPADNGVNNSDEVSFSFKIETQENGSNVGSDWQLAANGGTAGESNNYSVATTLGNVYSANVTSGYSVGLVTDSYTFTMQSGGTYVFGWISVSTAGGPSAGVNPSDPGAYGSRIDVVSSATASYPYGLSAGGSKTYTYTSTDPNNAIDLQSGVIFEVVFNDTWTARDGNGRYFQGVSTYTIYQDRYTAQVAASEADTAYLARPLPPAIALVPGNAELDATFTNDANNNNLMTFVRFQQSIDSTTLTNNGTGNTEPGTKNYGSLTNGTTYTIRAQAVYKYPSDGAEFESSVTVSAATLDAVPFGKPIINSVTIDGSNKGVIVNMSNNGRKLREMLVVGIPLDSAASQAIEYLRFDATTNPVIDAGEDNNVDRDLSTVTFVQSLKEAFVVLENDAGSSAAISN